MAKKLSATEHVILEITDREIYGIYRCPTHGIYVLRRPHDSTDCPYKCGHVANSEYGGE
ncbi:hypothetical protein [Paenibacillus sp.]|uniref:hypothetical protein n=1 Tax=Paenibacillus sp. TaxID=58172 RepID=UPI0028AD03EA|nr:hypothetical protein [Paenibacillus sp.]